MTDKTSYLSQQLYPALDPLNLLQEKVPYPQRAWH
jgi:hypothetical protein